MEKFQFTPTIGALIVAALFSVLAQMTGLDQVADTWYGRTFIGLFAGIVFVYFYNKKTSIPNNDGTSTSIHSTFELTIACVVAVVAALSVSLIF